MIFGAVHDPESPAASARLELEQPLKTEGQ